MLVKRYDLIYPVRSTARSSMFELSVKYYGIRLMIWPNLKNKLRLNSIKKRNIVFIISRTIQAKVHEDKTYSGGLRRITSLDQNKIYRSVSTTEDLFTKFLKLIGNK